jgi:cephalosporin hydroxylase
LAPYPGLRPLDTDQKAAGREELRQHLLDKHEGRAARSFFAVHTLVLLDGEANWPPEALETAQRTIDRIVQLRTRGRFVDFFSRRTLAATSVSPSAYAFSQGVSDVNRWKGLPLFKGVFDAAVYPLLLMELRPATIIEFGSEAGASAVWLADLAATLGVQCHLYSIDLEPPALTHERVTFLRGDSNVVAEALPSSWLKTLPHPWLVIEDAHVNIGGVLAHLADHLRSGDYVVIEDANAERDIGLHLLSHPGQVLVDTFFTDYFGCNATCSPDQILRVM